MKYEAKKNAGKKEWKMNTPHLKILLMGIPFWLIQSILLIYSLCQLISTLSNEQHFP